MYEKSLKLQNFNQLDFQFFLNIAIILGLILNSFDIIVDEGGLCAHGQGHQCQWTLHTEVGQTDRRQVYRSEGVSNVYTASQLTATLGSILLIK